MCVVVCVAVACLLLAVVDMVDTHAPVTDNGVYRHVELIGFPLEASSLRESSPVEFQCGSMSVSLQLKFCLLLWFVLLINMLQ